MLLIRQLSEDRLSFDILFAESDAAKVLGDEPADDHGVAELHEDETHRNERVAQLDDVGRDVAETCPVYLTEEHHHTLR